MISTIFGIPGPGQNLPATDAELTMLQCRLRGEKWSADNQLHHLKQIIKNKKEAVAGTKSGRVSEWYQNQAKANEILRQIYVLEQIEEELVNYNKLLEKELKQINKKLP